MSPAETYTFDEFRLEVSERRLSKNDCPISLAPKAYDLLVALVRNSGRLLAKRELLDLVWPDSFVEEGILAVHVSALRKALGSGPGRSYIETISRAGYRFTGAVSTSESALARATKQHATRAEVYELVGRGRAHLLAASLFEIPKAVEAFRAAIDADGAHAAAHAGLALACCAQAQFRLAVPDQAYEEARKAALRALALDDACADAQVALGAVLFLSDWNWLASQRSLERALQLNPNHTEAYLLYGSLLEAVGELDRGLEMKLRALERDPLSPLVHLQISMSYWNQRRYDDSIQWAEKTLNLDPRHLGAREHLAGAYFKKGDLDRHMQENIKHAASYGVSREALDHLQQIYRQGGRAAVVKLSLERASSQAFPAIQSALLHAEAGNLDEAFRHLERAIESHDPALVYLAVGPQFDSLRTDPRFNQCVARVGLLQPV
jgi:DNA-binding winged helix-turn-helix (wHTH) protein